MRFFLLPLVGWLVGSSLAAQQLTGELVAGYLQPLGYVYEYRGEHGDYLFDSFEERHHNVHGLRLAWQPQHHRWRYAVKVGVVYTYEYAITRLRSSTVRMPFTSLAKLSEHYPRAYGYFGVSAERLFQFASRWRGSIGGQLNAQWLTPNMPYSTAFCGSDQPIVPSSLAFKDATIEQHRTPRGSAELTARIEYWLGKRLMLSTTALYHQQLHHALAGFHSTDEAFNAAIRRVRPRAVGLRFGLGWVFKK